MAVVKVICKHLKNNPQCSHGPTLRFVRATEGGEQEFFACSAYRDRKDCGFYLAVDAGPAQTQRVEQHWFRDRLRELPSVDHPALEARLKEVCQALPKDRLYCHTCCQLDLTSRSDDHRTHRVTADLSDFTLAHPSQILLPKEGSKKEAQYLFAPSTTEVIVSNLLRAGVTRVVCLGTPRVHEHIQAMADGDGKLQSILLDIDHRHHAFWPADKFGWFNMFNRHWLCPQPRAARSALRRLLRASAAVRGRVALIMDPPFGGHVQPLAATLRHFTRLVARLTHTELLVIWVFPYFRERHILEQNETLTMMDYRVQYDNHKQFNNGAQGRKLGSPVRLFTNMAPAQFQLPRAEGYRMCRPCGRWVAAENKHCPECNACTSKDGRTYVHCFLCGSCVKPQWSHCVICKTCLPSPHVCRDQMRKCLNDGNGEPRLSKHVRKTQARQDSLAALKTKVRCKKKKLK